MPDREIIKYKVMTNRRPIDQNGEPQPPELLAYYERFDNWMATSKSRQAERARKQFRKTYAKMALERIFGIRIDGVGAENQK